MSDRDRRPLPRQTVRNAADPQQVRRAERIERDRLERFGLSLQAVMATAEGRLVLWELLARAGVFRSIYDQSAKIYYNAGRQDFGHEILTELLKDSASYLLMESEMRALADRDARGDAAATQPRDVEGEIDGR